MNSTRCDDESVGYYWSQAAKEQEAMERHDREHPGDPTQWWQDCEICADRVEAEHEKNHEHALDQMVAADIDFSREQKCLDAKREIIAKQLEEQMDQEHGV